MCQGPEFTKIPAEKTKATLVLQNGQRFQGYSFGAQVSIGGEVGKIADNNLISREKLQNPKTFLKIRENTMVCYYGAVFSFNFTRKLHILLFLFPQSFRQEWLVIQKP